MPESDAIMCHVHLPCNTVLHMYTLKLYSDYYCKKVRGGVYKVTSSRSHVLLNLDNVKVVWLTK